MGRTHSLLLIALIFTGLSCNEPSSSTTIELTKVRKIYPKAHTLGTLAEDPILKPGETILFHPEGSEKYGPHNSTLVTLPSSTPYKGEKQKHYLLGYATGKWKKVNLPFV